MSSLFTLGKDSELKFWINDLRLYSVDLEKCSVVAMEVSDSSIGTELRTLITLRKNDKYELIRSPVLLREIPFVQHATKTKEAPIWLCFWSYEKLVLDLSGLTKFSYKDGELLFGFRGLPKTYESVVAEILKE